MAYRPDKDELTAEILTRAVDELAALGMARKDVVFALVKTGAALARHDPNPETIATVLRGSAALIDEDVAKPSEIN